MMTSHFNSMISTTLKKYLILLFSLVASIGVSAQEKEVEVGMKCIVETAIIDSVDCSNEYFIKDVYVDYCVYTDDITLSIYGDVPKVTGNITPTDSAIETEIDVTPLREQAPVMPVPAQKTPDHPVRRIMSLVIRLGLSLGESFSLTLRHGRSYMAT